MKTIFFYLFILIQFCAPAQTNNDLPGRQPFVLKMPVDKHTQYVDSVHAGPFIVHADIIQLYPGETILVEALLENGQIKSLKTVKENLHPELTIEINIKQVLEKNVHQVMMLTVKNPFKQALVYAAKIFLLKQKRWVDTDVIPVSAGLSSFETWPDIFTSIALSDWKLSKE